MKKLFFIAITLCIFVPFKLFAKINVFACEPEWGSLASEIAQDKVNIFTATHALQDPHYIRARPSLIAKINRADLVFCSGAGLEEGWLPILLSKANKQVQPKEVGYLMASDFVDLLEIPLKTDRSLGHIHPQGNPHVHLNPNNLFPIARELVKRLKLLDPQNISFFKDQLKVFEQSWQVKIRNFQNQAKPLAGKNVIVHHNAFSYLLDWLKINQSASLEPKPGVAPSVSHLEKLLINSKNNNDIAIIRAPYENKKPSLWLSEKSTISAVVLPYTVGFDEDTNDLTAVFENSINLLLNEL